MADTKITALTALTAADPANDVIPIVDVSDTSMAASGTTKKISVNNILGASGVATLASATITGALTVDTTTLVVDATNDRVGVKTASPADILEVVGSGATGIRVSRSGALTQYATLSAGATGPTLDASSALSSLSFGIAGTTAVTINSTGNLVLKGGTAGATGVGLTFPATQVASSDANCLDDYEEGTFTPTISSGATAVTFSTQDGKYTKVGRLVTIYVRITTTVAARNGSIFTISGLPFSSATDGAGVIAYNSSGFISTAGGNKPNLILSGTGIEFYTSNGGNFVGTAIAADVFDLRLTATYYV
jgi:hypothetical protein